MDVAETIEELRRHIDELIGRLAESGREPPARSGIDEDRLVEQIEELGRKVEAASDLLAELADVLDAQTERIETIEQQLGDPDASAELSDPSEEDAAAFARGGQETSPSRGEGSLAASLGGLAAELWQRLDRIEERLAILADRVEGLERLGREKEERVRELEERLLILVDARGPAPVGDQVAPPSDEGAPEAPRRGGNPPRVDPEGSQPGTPGANGSGVEKLASLVERAVSATRDFPPGATVAPHHGQDRLRSRASVMVVDDVADARLVLSLYLSKTGYQVVTAASAEDCLAKLLHHDVDAVILDARLPGADAGHVLRVMAEDPAYASKRGLPVIVYTGYPEEFPREKVLAWGAADYVVKSGDLLPLVSSLVRLTEPRREARQ